MFNKLNGWQRLWVVASTLLLLVFAFFGYLNLPIEIVDPDMLGGKGIDLDHPECQKIIDHLKKEPGYDTFNFVPDSVLSDLRACYRKAQFKERVAFVAKMFGVWLATIAFIYGAGFSVAWVRSGFRRNKES